jgi:hypothetical protein
MEHDNPHFYIVDDLQQVQKIKTKEEANHHLILNGELSGIRISKNFVYKTEKQAHQEVADRHTRLNKAFKTLDLVSCLSINKEPSRKLEGLSLEELKVLAKKDKEDYIGWLKKLEKNYEEINNEKPDLEKLAKTLKNAHLVQKALEDPLAIDFIEIMSKEAQIKKSREAKKIEVQKNMEGASQDI